MARPPWEAKQAWIVRPKGVTHGLRTRRMSHAEAGVEIVLVNVERPHGGEVSLWIDDEARRRLIIALGGQPIDNPLD